MSRRLLSITSISLLTLFIAASVVGAAAKKKPNKVPGDEWSYTISQGDKKESGTFRVLDLVIYKDDKKVGSATRTAAGDTSLTFTGMPELNGKAEVHKVKAGVAAGTLKKTDGTEWEFHAKITGD